MSQRHLSVYLNDHLAGSAAALEILESLRDAPQYHAWAERLHSEIEADRSTLRRVMASLDVSESVARKTTGWVAEHLLELKTALDDRSDGSLRQLELIEALALGIDGKQALWLSLRRLDGVAFSLREFDLAGLIGRAEEQRQAVEQKRMEAVAAALDTRR